jgi:hypothetical protein
MNHDTPLSPRPLQQLASGSRRLLTTAQLRARGESGVSWFMSGNFPSPAPP